MAMKIMQEAEYQGKDWWSWSVWIDAAVNELNEIQYVEYTLHPTFVKPVREKRDRSTKFRLYAEGSDTFTIYAKAYLKNDSTVSMKHDLELFYPDGEPANNVDTVNPKKLARWNDLEQLELELTRALTSFNWQVVEENCQKLISKIYEEMDVFPESTAKRLLSKLRRKRRFHLMSVLGEAIIRSEQNHPQIRRQYAQSLIDQGLLSAAEYILQSIIQNPSSPKSEVIEANGLIGRIYKQLYVNITGKNNPKKQIFFEQALNAYSYGYRLDQNNYWNAINIIAMLKRARRDGISLQGLPDAEQLAEEVLDILKTAENESVTSPQPWEIATNLEALIALNRYDEAIAKALEYSLCLDADAFEINSTLRQLIEVWQLDTDEFPGSKILPILSAALLRREGGAVNLTPQVVSQEIEGIKQIGFEKVFGHDKTQTLNWYQKGLERTRSVARIETLNGKPIGTGWLVRSKDFFPNSSGLLLITNAHVVSTNPADSGLPPDRVRANFQGLNKVYEIDKLVWTKPQENLDTTFLTIKGNPPVEPVPINKNSVTMCEPPPRVYIIGHPGGRDLEISLHDSHLVACDETFLHYRTPTEGGSSGSPVFDQEFWEVVALHHRGNSNMQRLDGKEGVYEANEGITILAIQKAIQNDNSK